MKTIRNKLADLYRKHTPSVKIPLVIFVVIICMVPLIVEGRILASSSKQNQVERRIIDVQNQCQIFSNKMTRTGYLSGSVTDNAGIDTEMSMLADIFNGRIIIVNSGFKIVKDTFSLSEGKLCISEETIRSFLGESTKKYNTEKHYFVLAIPIMESAQSVEVGAAAKTAGVMLVTASTESMLELEDVLNGKASMFQLIMFVVVVIAAICVVQTSLRPFDAIVSSINRVAEGNMDEDIEEETYSETKKISRALTRMLETIKSVEQSRQEFVSNVSHELKTPITSIRVVADSLMGMEELPQ